MTFGLYPFGTHPFGYVDAKAVKIYPQSTLISQYANSPIILALMDNISEYYDQEAIFKQFYDNIWNIETAVGVGLDMWGKIVDVGRVLYIPDMTSPRYSFNTASETDTDGPFATSANGSSTFILEDSVYRLLILTKALANIVGTNAPSLNRLLRILFAGRGRCYVIDDGDMAMTYKFEFTLSAAERQIIEYSGALPHPAGVSVTIDSLPTA
jgi:hypothetical protein